MVKPWRTPNRTQKETGKAGVQSSCVDWARRRKWWARKIKSPANRGLPDYAFSKIINGAQVVLAVEFKRWKKKKPTDKQADEHALMRAAGWRVEVIDNKESFVALFESLEQQPTWLT